MRTSSELKKALLTLLSIFSVLQIVILGIIEKEKTLSKMHFILILSITLFQVFFYIFKISKQNLVSEKSSYYIGIGGLLNAISFAVSASFLIGITLNETIIIFIVLLVVLVCSSFLFGLFFKNFSSKNYKESKIKAILLKVPSVVFIAIIIAFLRFFTITSAMSMLLILSAIGCTICCPLIFIYKQ